MRVTLKRDPIFALTVPGKIQSYMACGKPIIAALDGEGNRLVTESGAGIVSSSEDPAALAKSVKTGLTDPPTLHPVIDPNICVGAKVSASPIRERILPARLTRRTIASGVMSRARTLVLRG